MLNVTFLCGLLQIVSECGVSTISSGTLMYTAKIYEVTVFCKVSVLCQKLMLLKCFCVNVYKYASVDVVVVTFSIFFYVIKGICCNSICTFYFIELCQKNHFNTTVVNTHAF